jgi:hypothetical protein
LTKDQADNQAKELLRLCREKAPKQIKIGEMNIIDVDKFLNAHKCRMDFLTTFSREWKTHYLRLYLLKKDLYLEQKKLDND